MSVWTELLSALGLVKKSVFDHNLAEALRLRDEVVKLKSTLRVPRAVELSEQKLAGLLNVPDDHPVLRGVLEVMARAEDMTVEDYCKPGASAEYRAEGGVAVRAIRSLRADVLAAVEMARGPKKKTGGQ